MNQQTLEEAKYLDSQIRKTNEELSLLQRPNIVIKVHGLNGSGESLLSTIGTSDNCEHPDTDLAKAFLQALIQRRQEESTKLHDKFNSL